MDGPDPPEGEEKESVRLDPVVRELLESVTSPGLGLGATASVDEPLRGRESEAPTASRSVPEKTTAEDERSTRSDSESVTTPCPEDERGIPSFETDPRPATSKSTVYGDVPPSNAMWKGMGWPTVPRWEDHWVEMAERGELMTSEVGGRGLSGTPSASTPETETESGDASCESRVRLSVKAKEEDGPDGVTASNVWTGCGGAWSVRLKGAIDPGEEKRRVNSVGMWTVVASGVMDTTFATGVYSKEAADVSGEVTAFPTVAMTTEKV